MKSWTYMYMYVSSTIYNIKNFATLHKCPSICMKCHANACQMKSPRSDIFNFRSVEYGMTFAKQVNENNFPLQATAWLVFDLFAGIRWVLDCFHSLTYTSVADDRVFVVGDVNVQTTSSPYASLARSHNRVRTLHALAGETCQWRRLQLITALPHC